jgi:hypothetical protein
VVDRRTERLSTPSLAADGSVAWILNFYYLQRHDRF